MNLTTNYFKMPNNIFDLGLTPSEFVVVTYLTRLENNNNKAFPSYKTIAENCNISERTAKTVVKSLVEKGLLLKVERFIEKNNKKYNDTNLYKLSNKIFVSEVEETTETTETTAAIEETAEDFVSVEDDKETLELIEKYYSGEVTVPAQTEEEIVNEKIAEFQTYLNKEMSYELRSLISELDWSEIVAASMQISNNKNDKYCNEKYIINAINDNRKPRFIPNLKAS